MYVQKVDDELASSINDGSIYKPKLSQLKSVSNDLELVDADTVFAYRLIQVL